MSQDFTEDKSTSGNGLVSPGNKPLHEPMLTQICVTIWLHQATVIYSYNMVLSMATHFNIMLFNVNQILQWKVICDII